MLRCEVEFRVLVASQPLIPFGLVGGEIVENDMNFAIRMNDDDLVHKVKKLDPPASPVVAADGLAAPYIERRKQHRRSMPICARCRNLNSTFIARANPSS